MGITRKQVEDKAREYVGTPFRHQGRIKGKSCDCVGLPLMLCDELGIIDRTGVPVKKTDNSNYSAQPLDSFVHTEAQRRFIEKPISEMKPGDMVTIRLPKIPCHVAILCTTCGVLGMIHAYTANGKVVEHVMDDKWKKRIAGCFQLPGVIDG